MREPRNHAAPLPVGQQEIRAECFHPTGTFVQFPKEEIEQSIPERFEKIVRRYPDRTAVKTKDQAVTFTELNAMANGIARWLIVERGSEPDLIGLSLDKGIPFVAAMLGVLKAGKFFVIIDPSLPHPRIASALKDLRVKLLFVEPTYLSAAANKDQGDCEIVPLGALAPDACGDCCKLTISPSATACLFYTAGSTGQPKAVIQSHRNLLHYQLARAESDGLQQDDRYGHLTSATSNAISHVLFCVLNGATLLLYDMKQDGVANLAAWLVEEQITICNMGAPLFRHFCSTLSGQEKFSELRLLRLGSDTVYQSDVELHKVHFPATCALSIGYSTSETGGLTEYRGDHEHDLPGGELPVGRVFEDKEILLLDDDDRSVGSNAIGEIVVRSRYLSPGYWNRPELTAEKFKGDADDPERRLYFTGDLGLMLPDGCLIHKGRKDFRVKIRGYGVDLAEVEKHLRSHPQVKEAVVVARPDDSGTNQLAAYFTADEPTVPNGTDLRGHLKQQLPDYMIPAIFAHLDALPLTPDGKINRRALLAPDQSRSELEDSYVTPRNRIEEQLAGIWAELFKLDKVGINDNFFDLGGHSLLAGRLVVQIRRTLRADLPLSVLFESPTIGQLASRIEFRDGDISPVKRQKPASSLLVKLQTGSGRKLIFCFPYIGGAYNEFFHFIQVARHFGPDYSFYGLRAPGLDAQTAPLYRMEEMAAQWLREIQKLQPRGPYLLVGECLGGVAAYETARQLERMGETVSLLAFLDTKAWSWGGYLRHQFTVQIARRLRESWIWSYALTRTKFHFTVFRQLDLHQGLRYLTDKTSKAVTIFPYALRHRGVAGRQASNSDDDNARDRAMQIKRVEDAFFNALWRYRLRPYRGRISLLVNEQSYASNPTLGWTNLAVGGLDIYKLPGDHDACVPENVPLVASILKECLEKVEKNIDAASAKGKQP